MAGFNLYGDAPNMVNTPYGTPMGEDYSRQQAVGGQQQATQGMLGQMAHGGGPNPALATMQAGTDQAQRFAEAQAGSARGAAGIAGAQHGAMQTGAQLGQQAAQQGGILAQQQQFQAIQMQMQQQAQMRMAELQAMGMDRQAAEAQAQMELQQNMANQQTSSSLLNGGIGAAGALLGGLAMAL